MKSPDFEITHKRSSPPRPEERAPEGEWLPNDSLYTREEWQKIKDAINPISTGLTFRHIAQRLIVNVSNYRCAVIEERPEQVVGYKFRSDENRKGLRKAIKALTNVKNVFASGKKANRTEKKYLKISSAILQRQFLRLEMLNLDAVLASNEKVNDVINWLGGNETALSAEDFSGVIDLAITTFTSQKNLTSRPGRPNKHARKNLLNNLKLIWEEAKGISPTVITDRDTFKISGDFYDFVYAVLRPISEQLDDKVDIRSLGEAVKREIYRAKK